MHELSIVQGIVETVKRHIPVDELPRKVKWVRIRIGALAGVIPESLQSCFEIGSAGTILQGAELKIDRVPALSRCQVCRSNVEFSYGPGVCPRCHSASLEVQSGEELDVVEVVLEEDSV